LYASNVSVASKSPCPRKTGQNKEILEQQCNEIVSFVMGYNLGCACRICMPTASILDLYSGPWPLATLWTLPGSRQIRSISRYFRIPAVYCFSLLSLHHDSPSDHTHRDRFPPHLALLQVVQEGDKIGNVKSCASITTSVTNQPLQLDSWPPWGIYWPSMECL
jgi:hypothetical protein